MEDYKQKYLKLCRELAELRFFNVPTDSPSLREAKDFGESLKYDGRIIEFKHNFLKLKNVADTKPARLILALPITHNGYYPPISWTMTRRMERNIYQ